MSASYPHNPPPEQSHAGTKIKMEHPTPLPPPLSATSAASAVKPEPGMTTIKPEPRIKADPNHLVKPEPHFKHEANVKSEYFKAKPEPGTKQLDHAPPDPHRYPSPSARESSIRQREPTLVPTHDSSQPYDRLMLSRLPTEIWSNIFADIVTSCSLGQLLLCAAVCRDWRHLILNNTDLERFLDPFARTLGNVHATPARGKKTPARSLGENLARAYGKSKMCESCGLKGKINKVGLFRMSNASLCLHCRVEFLASYNHPGRPLIHNRGDVVPGSDCKRMGIPEKYVKERMRVVATCENPHAPSSHPMKLYSVEEARRAAYAATQSLEPIRLESEPFRRLVYVGGGHGGRRGAGGRRWRGAGGGGGMTYEEWEDAMYD